MPNPTFPVILSEAKNLHQFASDRKCRSFASLRMTSEGLRMTAPFVSIAGPQVQLQTE